MGYHLFVTLSLLAAQWLVAGGMKCSCHGGMASGRSVSVTADTLTLSGRFGKDTATISLGGKKLVVEPARLLIEEKEVAAIDPAARRILVTSTRGKILVTADGETVYDSRKP